jgi:hypothetical protein
MDRKLLTRSAVAALALGALSACAVTPIEPTVRVMPARGKPLEVFDAEDMACRDHAARHAGVGTQEAANASAVNSAVVGATVGAAAGALIGGSGRAAGTGAGMGLLMGTAVGSEQSTRSGYAAQRRYDTAYTQCMYAKGNVVPGQAAHPSYYAYPPPPPPPGSAPPPPPGY